MTPVHRLSSIFFALIVAGCSQQPLVRTFSVPKEPVPANRVAAPATDRMLVGMVNRPDQVWFIKAVGPAERIAPDADRLKQLVQGISFNDAGEPQWELPSGWAQSEGNAIRFATITMGEGPDAIPVSVISLPAPQEVLANVNRWREQLGQAPVAESELSQCVEDLTTENVEIAWVDLSGSFSATRSPPFAGGAAQAAVPSADKVSATPEVPDSWKPGRAGGMRKAAYQIAGDGGNAEVTVIALAELPLLDNVNRWREQVGLEAIEADQLGSVVQPIEVGTLQGDYVQLVGESEGKATTLLVVMVNHDRRSWFFKMMGDSSVVEQEKEAFERFVKSAAL